VSLPADLGIVVVNFGFPTLLETNLVPLARHHVPERVVVVDNFSGIAQRAATTALARREGWTLIAPALNLGFGAGVNAGAHHLITHGCQRLLLLNPDALIDEAGVNALADGCSADPASLQCPRIERSDGTVWFAGGVLDVGTGLTRTGPGSDSSAPNGWVTGACLMVHASMWQWLNGFDERYFLYWEDVDLSWRCAKAGGTLVVRDDVTVVHGVGGTQEGTGKSRAYVYFNIRNRLLFAASHLDRRHLLRWWLVSPGYAAEVVQRGGRRDLLRHLAPLLTAALRGSVRGAALTVTALLSNPGPRGVGASRPLQPVPEES
jgi:N-acetylglucosaminyl-diphospho-decaprenol L-rhamnosyltransferase